MKCPVFEISNSSELNRGISCLPDGQASDISNKLNKITDEI